MELHGRERLTLELSGRLSPAVARDRVAGLPLVEDERGAEVALLYFAMDGLRPGALRWPAFRYRELLLRLGVVWQGEPAWLAVRCELDSPLVAAMARRTIRYDVGMARLDERDDHDRLAIEVTSSAATLRLVATPTGEHPEPVSPRRTLVRAAERLWEVPWRETPAPDRAIAGVAVEVDTLSAQRLGAEVAWAARGLVHRGRLHHCGLAHPVDG